MGRNGQLLREGAEALGVSHAPLQPQRRPLRRSAARVRTGAGSTPSGRCTSPTCRARSPPEPACAPASRRAGSSSSAGGDGRSTAVPASRAADGAGRRPFTLRARARRRPRRRRLRHPRAAAALGLSLPERPARAQPAHPPGLLGRRALRRGGARLGRRHAELRGRRVGAAGAAARGDLHPARLRRPVAARGRRASTRSGCSASATSPRPASTSPTSRGAGCGWPATARCGSATSSRRDDADRLVFGIARAAELLYAAGAREVYPQISGIDDAAARADRRARGLAPAAAPRCAWRRFTRWARRAWTPTRGAAWSAADGAVHGAERLYVADASLLPSSIGVNPMMTIIAMASRVARQSPTAAPELNSDDGGRPQAAAVVHLCLPSVRARATRSDGRSAGGRPGCRTTAAVAGRRRRSAAVAEAAHRRRRPGRRSDPPGRRTWCPPPASSASRRRRSPPRRSGRGRRRTCGRASLWRVDQPVEDQQRREDPETGGDRAGGDRQRDGLRRRRRRRPARPRRRSVTSSTRSMKSNDSQALKLSVSTLGASAIPNSSPSPGSRLLDVGTPNQRQEHDDEERDPGDRRRSSPLS